MSRCAAWRGLLAVLAGLVGACEAPEPSGGTGPVERCADHVRVDERTPGLDSELPPKAGLRSRRTVRHDVAIEDKEGRERARLHDADEDGRVDSEYSLTYDTVGRVSVRDDGRLIERFFYDSEGRKIEERRDGGSWSARRLFSYDAQGRLTREVAEGEFSREFVEHTYDGQGRPATITTTDSSLGLRTRVSHSYDPGLRTHTEREDSFGSEPHTTVTVAHLDAGDRPLLEERMDERGAIYEIELHEYDEKGRVLLAETFDREGGLDRIRLHESRGYDDSTGASFGFGFGEDGQWWWGEQKGIDCRSVTAPSEP